MSAKSDPRRGLNAEIRRLRSALGAIHDALHANEIDRAHALTECAIGGQTVSQRNLTPEATAMSMGFASEFNALAEKHRARACCVLVLPSATVENAVSLQLCGEVAACKIVEERLRGHASVYMGDHAEPEKPKAPPFGLLVAPGSEE